MIYLGSFISKSINHLHHQHQAVSLLVLILLFLLFSTESFAWGAYTATTIFPSWKGSSFQFWCVHSLEWHLALLLLRSLFLGYSLLHLIGNIVYFVSLWVTEPSHRISLKHSGRETKRLYLPGIETPLFISLTV
jgi:hypothetical protein